jgi:hypothetical protein
VDLPPANRAFVSQAVAGTEEVAPEERRLLIQEQLLKLEKQQQKAPEKK